LNAQLTDEEQLTRPIDGSQTPTITAEMEAAIQQFKHILGEAVKRRVADVPHLA
jgi:hypothetical protein